jgi:Phosphotyrosyl phosphate activator (PTPA) protein
MLSDHQHSQGCGHENNSAPNIPTKEILTPEDLAKFHKSLAFEKYFGFITALNDAIKNKCLIAIRDLSSKLDDSHIVKKLELLLSAWKSSL